MSNKVYVSIIINKFCYQLYATVLVALLLLLMSSKGIAFFIPKYLNNNHLLTGRSRTFFSQLDNTQKRPISRTTIMKISAITNRELAEQRLDTYRARNEAIKESVEKTRQRNLELKRLLYETSSDTNTSNQDLFQVKVTICEELRKELKPSGREKRGRIFLEKDSDAMTNIRALKRELHGFFRALRGGTYILSAGYPIVSDDGKVMAIQNGTSWSIETDEDVQMTFEKAHEFFYSQQSTSLKRPAIVIQVERDPNAPKPPPPPEYLNDMADPNETTHMTMLSFYSFPKNGIINPDEYAILLRKVWKPFNALGRIYVANEGINAQMSVPTNILHNFIECCNTLPQGVGTYIINNGGVNVDPIPLSLEEFASAGVPATAGTPAPPFKNLHIRVRTQVVADGLDRTYDWEQAGYDMPPLEWHEKLKEAKEREQRGEPGITLLDCRNNYETDVGRFELAEPLDTTNFRESWDVLKERLKDTPKDAPIMMYCTGGIRCVKTGAYVTQELGFKNVMRLKGGIIAYDRTLSEKMPEEESMFKGTNFVFDGRLGRPITEDSFGTCITCGSETSLVSNCRNENCHKRMIQCENCRTSFHGACSDACRNRVLNGAMRPLRTDISTGSVTSEESTEPQAQPVFKTLEEYSSGHSSPPPSVYPEMELNTRTLIPSGSHMVSGSAQGRLLNQLASMTREGRILELGTFTGYATACLLEGSANAGRSIGVESCGTRQSGPYVLSMERDTKAYEVAVAQLKVVTEHGTGEEAAEMMCALRSKNAVPAINDDAVILQYQDITSCELLKVSDALATVEEMAAGRSENQPAPFDMVFLDADKTRLIEYCEALLSSDNILKKGGLIIVDNVLWKGLVIEANNGDYTSLELYADSEEAEIRKNKRARKLANKMHRFNSEIVKDPRVEVLVLPMRDGLSVIRKK